jgi:hypothetical protein
MKFFISQGMRNKTDEEINAEREKIINDFIIPTFGENNVEIIESKFDISENVPEEVLTEPVYWLGKSIQKLAEANFLICSPDYFDYNGCKVEREIAERYGISVLVASYEPVGVGVANIAEDNVA